MKESNIKNIIMVVFSNVITILVALFMGFILPKQFDVENYAYYRVYALYILYAGFFHFGFVNGIYLKYGHLGIEELPEKVFRRYSRVMLWMQLIVCVILAGILKVASQGMEESSVMAWVFIIINIPLINIKWFFSSINQFTKRFVIDSYVTLLLNVLTLLGVILVSVCHWYHFVYLLVMITITNFVVMLIVMMQNKTLWIGKAESGLQADIQSLIKSGFFLMLSEFVGMIILGIDSMFVDNLFTIHEFAMYSFAVSIVSVLYSLITTVSNLVYPYLVRAQEENYARYYSIMSDVFTVLSIMALASYYIVSFIVKTWIPKYEESLLVTAILFGTVIFRTLIMLVCCNYFKVLKLIQDYTKNNIMAIVISFIFNMIAYFAFHNYIYIAVASLVSFIVWYIITDQLFIKRLSIQKSDWIKRYIGIVMSLLVFYLSLRMSVLIGFIGYILVALIICLACFYREIKTGVLLIVNARQGTRKESK